MMSAPRAGRSRPAVVGTMTRRQCLAVMAVALVSGSAARVAQAQRVAVPGTAPVEFGVLRGRWVRPDGGYVIDIRGVDAGGKLEASYANPRPLPFAKAEATREGAAIKLFLELRAGGYDGSNYALIYDPASDRLVGVYSQAVAKQKFDVYFERAR